VNVRPDSLIVMKKVKSVAEYFASIPPQSRKTLNKLRKTIKAVVPGAIEVMYYQLPSFRHGRALVAYGAFSDHCSFFPLSAAIVERFRHELSQFNTSRGTIRFPVDKPLPSSVVRKIVRARIEQNQERERDRRRADAKRHPPATGKSSFPEGLARPAQRALAQAGILNLKQLAKWNERDVRSLHGIGPNAFLVLRKSLTSHGLRFASKTSTRHQQPSDKGQRAR
jgi:uncharacterized protein YdhG (YjbR/CyaY superfamily)